MNELKYPNVFVQLSGENGNIFSVIGRVCRALRKGVSPKKKLMHFGRKQKVRIIIMSFKP